MRTPKVSYVHIDMDRWERRLHEIVYVYCMLTHLVVVHCLCMQLTLVRTHGTGRPSSVARPSRASRDPPRAPEDPPSGPRLTLMKRKASPPL